MRKAIAAGLILTLVFAPATISYSQEIPEKNVLTIGKATRKISEWQERFEPIITYLASRLGDVGIKGGEVLLARDNAAAIEYLREGRLDIVLETPFSACLYKIEVNARPILLAMRIGTTEYSSLIFVRKDSGIRRLEDLRGKIIAFEDPGSTSGYFLPKVAMIAEGLELVEINSANSSIPENKIGYVFAGEELNVSTWVYNKKTDAGVLSNLDWSDQEDNPESYRKDFEIIYETKKVPRTLVMVREGLDDTLVGRIKEELLNMHNTEEGRVALKTSKIDRFVILPGHSEDVLKPIEELIENIPMEELH